MMIVRILIIMIVILVMKMGMIMIIMMEMLMRMVVMMRNLVMMVVPMILMIIMMILMEMLMIMVLLIEKMMLMKVTLKLMVMMMITMLGALKVVVFQKIVHAFWWVNSCLTVIQLKAGIKTSKTKKQYRNFSKLAKCGKIRSDKPIVTAILAIRESP